MRIIPLAFVLCLSACGGDNNQNDEATQSTATPCPDTEVIDESNGVIWRPDSQRIVAVRFNGLTIDPDDRYDNLDQSRDTLNTCTKNALASLQLVEELACHEDNTTYDLTITDSNGLTKRYLSNNAACGHISNVDGYILLEDIQPAFQYVEWLD